MFIYPLYISNSGKVGRGAEHKSYERAFDSAWELFSIFRSDLFSAPRRGQISAGCIEYIFESKFPLVLQIGLAARACGSGNGQSPSNSVEKSK